MSDLSDYADLSARVAALGADDELTITAEALGARLAATTAFDGLVFDTSFQRSIGWAGEGDVPFEIVDRTFGFDAFAMPDGYRRLGLWLLHLLFSGREWAGLELTHPKSRARFFYARIQRSVAHSHGLQIAAPERYSGYVHAPLEVWRHPFAGLDMTPVQRIDAEEDRPFFAFGWSRGAMAAQHVIERSDQIIFEATPKGIAAMAGLMLDFPHPDLGAEEINIEPPFVGFAGTQPRSIEARFWLPGSLVFPEDHLDDIHIRPFPADR